MERGVIVLALFLLIVPIVAGCGSQPVSEEDATQIEVTLREYYEAMSSYDLESLQGTFTEDLWEQEGCKVSAAALLVKERDIGLELLSVKSIKISGESARVVARIETSAPEMVFTGDVGSAKVSDAVKTELSQREDRHSMLRRDGAWLITGPLNIETDVFYTPGLSTSACCPK